MKKLMEGKSIIVTGGAGGIGAATVKKFAEEGAAFIMIVDLNLEAAQKVADETSAKYGTECAAVQANISKEEDILNVFRIYREKQTKLDVLHNCAGIGRMVAMDDITIAGWDLTMNVNLRATFLFSREAMKIMKEQKSGHIINMSSQAGKSGGLVIGMDYTASKGGILALTKSLAKVGAPDNITVNTVAPGLIATDMTTTFGYDAKTVPLGRIGTAEEVADVILFAASDMSRYMTGACLDVNGGISMW